MKTTRLRAQAFARRMGVTVRALHHYDHLGLLKPAGRTAAGHRWYGAADVERLQQIVTLKYIGFPLGEIKRLLNGANLATALRAQRRTLEQKRRHLDQAISAIARTEAAVHRGGATPWRLFRRIIEEIQMQNNSDWTRKYYDREAQEQIEQRAVLWTPELQETVSRQWAELIQDVEAAAEEGIDPSCDRARALGTRWTDLIQAFTGGSTAIGEGLGRLWSDAAQWPESAQRQVFEPLAQRGVPAAQGSAPRLLSERADVLLKAILAGGTNQGISTPPQK